MIRGSAGEVRFERFGLLSGQKRPSDRARSAGEQTKGGSWGGPFWRICAAQRTKRSTRERKEHRSTATGQEDTKQKISWASPLCTIPAALSPRRATARSTAKQTRTGRAGEARFAGFGPLSGQNGQPERARSTAKQMKSRQARKVRFDGLVTWAAERAKRTTRLSKEHGIRATGKGPDQLGKPALGKPQEHKVDVTKPNTRHTRRPSMAQSATPATQNPTSRHNRGTASQLRKHVRVTNEEDFRVTDEGLSAEKLPQTRTLRCRRRVSHPT